MLKTKLTTAVVEAAEPGEKPYTIWDTDLAGFGLRVHPSGKRSWIAKYRVGGGGRSAQIRCPTIGDPMKISAKDARNAVKKEMASAQLGDDPRSKLKAQNQELTVAGLINLYEGEGCVVQRGVRIGEPMKPLTKQYTLARLRHHVVPLLGKRRVSDINAGDIETLHRAVSKGKTAKDEKIAPRKRVIVRGGDGAARKVVRDLSAVFAFAQRREFVKANPVTTASVRKTDNQRKRFLAIEEVKKLGVALDELEAAGVNPKAVNIARLWALTGCRRNQTAGLKWSEVDLDCGRLVLENSKTGRSIRPIGGPAVALLASLRKVADDKVVFVFPAERGEGFYQGTKKVWSEAIKKANLPGVTPHVLRHTLGSMAATTGETLLMVGSLLGHSNARSTSVYAHIAHDPSRLAADRVTSPLAEALGMKVPLEGGEEGDEV